MKQAIKDRLEQLRCFVLARLGEASTWQGIGFILTITGSRFAANFDWGAAAAIGGMVSALIKILFPDKKDHNGSDDPQA